MRCPKCNKNVYSHHQEINKARTEIKRVYMCRKCNCVFYTLERIVEEKKSSKIIIWSCNEYIKKTYSTSNLGDYPFVRTRGDYRTFLRTRIQCNDGFSISIQASACHYCRPRRTFEGPYTEVELGYPSCSEELLISFMEDDCCEPENTVYPYVPVVVVDRVIKKHGGIVYDVSE